MQETYLYVFVRQDISLPQQSVQSLHALYSLATLMRLEHSTPNIVFIGVPDLLALKRVASKLQANQIQHYCWTEPDEPEGFNSIATAPLDDYQRAALANYRLYRSQVSGVHLGTPARVADNTATSLETAIPQESAQADVQPSG